MTVILPLLTPSKPTDRRQYILDSLEHSRRREWLWVVVVAGVGFLTDAYNVG